MDLFQHNVIKINVKSVLLTQYITSRLQLIMLCARLRIVWRENEDFSADLPEAENTFILAILPRH